MANTQHLYKQTNSAARQSISRDNYFVAEAAGPQYSPSKEEEKRAAQSYAQPRPKFQTILVERFRQKLKGRGGRGLVGLKRQFKIYDVDGSGALELPEFKKAIEDFDLDLEEVDIENIFKSFDANRNGVLDFNEFLDVIVGPMNSLRENLVNKAFDKLDRHGQGVIDMQTLKSQFDPSRHPDVKNGKRNPEDVLQDFLETFEMHYNVTHGYSGDGSVSREEFIKFYENISSNIEKDAYFDLLVTNCWNLDNKNDVTAMPYAGSKSKVTQINSRERWMYDHHRSLLTGDKSTPFNRGDIKHEWSSTMRSTVGGGAADESYQPAAGVSTWPSGTNPSKRGQQTHESQRIASQQQPPVHQPAGR